MYLRCMRHATFEKISTSTLRQRIAERLRKAIVEGSLRPGERVVERRLASELGCSLTAVREALVQLEAEGFITKTPNSTTHVTSLSLAELEKSLALRRVLEGFALEEAARLITPEQIETMERCSVEMIEAADRGDGEQFTRKDLAFHEAIWESANNEFLVAALRRIARPQFAFAAMRINDGEEGNLSEVARNHLPLMEAMRSRDPHACRQAIEDVLDEYAAKWRAGGTRFEENQERRTEPSVNPQSQPTDSPSAQ
jgi:DNA-binding GntR family transcriptional regulator